MAVTEYPEPGTRVRAEWSNPEGDYFNVEGTVQEWPFGSLDHIFGKDIHVKVVEGDFIDTNLYTTEQVLNQYYDLIYTAKEVTVLD